MTLSAFMHSLGLSSRAETTARAGDPASASRMESGSNDALPASVLCARMSAKWMRQHRVGVEVRHGDQLVSAWAARVPAGRLVVHAQGVSRVELLAAAHLGVGYIVVESPRHVTLLSAGALRAVHVLLRSADDSSADEDDQRALNNAAVAHIIADPVLHLTGLHADIGCRRGAFVSIPAAIGQMIAEMAEVRERHGVAMSRVSVGIDADSAHLHQHTLDIEAALRDACRTVGFPLPSAIVSMAVPDRGSRAA